MYVFLLHFERHSNFCGKSNDCAKVIKQYVINHTITTSQNLFEYKTLPFRVKGAFNKKPSVCVVKTKSKLIFIL